MSSTNTTRVDETQTNGKIHNNGIPSATAHAASTEYMKSITIPMNKEPAFTPQKKLRVVTIGAGYAGMIFAHKILHKYKEEMNQLIEHTIFESKDRVGGTWVANVYPGVLCDVPSAIYVR